MEVKVKELFFKICQFSIVLILFISCRDGVDNIEGLWTGTRIIHGDSLDEPFSIRPLVYIKSDTLSYRTLGYIDDMYEKVDSLTTGFKLKKNSLYVSKLKRIINFKKITNDSVVANYPNELNTKYVFNRITENNIIENKKNLFQSKQYSFRGNGGSLVNIYFANDSLAVSVDKGDDITQFMRWELVNFKKQLFLLLNDEIGTIAMHLDSIDGNNIYLSEYSGSKSYIFKRQLNPKLASDSLLRQWNQHKFGNSKPIN